MCYSLEFYGPDLYPAGSVKYNSSQAALNRRKWLQLTSGALAAALTDRGLAGEGKGKWNDKNIAEYSQKLIDWLKENFAQRASTLITETGIEVKLAYDYLGPTEDRARLRVFEKFAEGSLPLKAREAHLTACLGELEGIRRSLATAEATASGIWKAPEGNSGMKEGKIYDSTVVASRLTVVLDNSPSMAAYLAALRKEISRDFSEAYFVEVNGCQMEREPTCPWFFAAASHWVNPFTPDRHIPKVPTLVEEPHSVFNRWIHDAPAALDCMVDLMKCDVIYWFCDFDDSTLDDRIKDFARKMMAQKAKLFIHTLDKKPPALLITLAEKSGGGVVRKRI